MEDRPELSTQLDSKTFRSYYYLKEELVDFCRENGLPVSGGKLEITDRIAHFLDTGEVVKPAKDKPKRAVASTISEIKEDTLIEEGFVCSEKHRAFFKEKIGPGFSFFVAFQKWLKSNAGKTYKDAIEAYAVLLQEKKTGRKQIDKQFEYNTYIRDFFEDNKGRSLEEAIACWKYKKSMPGHNRYEKKDLQILEEEK